MKKRFIGIMILLCVVAVASGQAITGNISQQEATNLLKSLNHTVADTARLNILLNLVEFHLRKGEENTNHLDSAAKLLKSANDLTVTQNAGKRDGVILLNESNFTRLRGDTIAARHLAEKAIALLQTTNDYFRLVLAYLALCRLYNSNKPEEATAMRKVFSELFQRVPKLINPGSRDKCMLELKYFYWYRMNTCTYIIKLEYINHLLQSYNTLPDKPGAFWARKEIADIHYQQGKPDLAITELQAIANEQKAGNYPQICFTYDLMAGIHMDRGKLDSALHYSLEAVKNVRTAFDSSHLPELYYRVASIYGVTGSKAEAINWNLKSLNYLVSVKQINNLYFTIGNIVADMIAAGKQHEALDFILDKTQKYTPAGNGEKRSMLLALAQAYAAVKKEATAEKYYDELIVLNDLRIKRKEIKNDQYADQVIAEFYLASGQYGKAEKYFRKVMDGWSRGEQTIGDYYSNFYFYKIDSAKGSYLSAIKHLLVYKKIGDSIYNTKRTKEIEALKVSFATEQKDQLINLKEKNIQLLTRQDELQKSQLRQSKMIRNIVLGFIALLSLLVALLYNRSRLKQRTNRELELQKREISKQVNEKDWLLKEIHHRVKNNLQIVMSLLNSQSAFIENEPALTAIHDSQHRVHAMSLIHQKLYNSENLSTIDMHVYIRELVSYLADSFNTGQRIRFEFDIDSLEMDVSQAVPLGLILNEAITNSIKYAFPGGVNGIISISLKNTAPLHYLLSVSDNGSGFAPDGNKKKAGSLGMSLMAGLSEDLDGQFSIENHKGTTVRVSFVLEPDAKKTKKEVASFV